MARRASTTSSLKSRLRSLLSELMLIPGLSGYEGRVRRHLAEALDELGIASRSDRLGNLIATLEGDEERAERHALHAHGPARLRRAKNRGERARARRAARRRAGKGASLAGGALLRRRRPRCAGRHRQQEPSRHDAGGEVPRPSLSRALHRRRLRQRRRGSRGRHRYRHAGRLPAAGDRRSPAIASPARRSTTAPAAR